MKKILILANSSIGLYNFRHELIIELINQGFKVYFSVPESLDNSKINNLIESGAIYLKSNFKRRSINLLYDIILMYNYRKIMNKVKPDVVLTYTIKPNIYGTFVASVFNIPVIMNITGLGSSFNSSKLRFIIYHLYKFACKRATFVFFQNEFNLKLFIYKSIVTKQKAKLIPGSGVNINKFNISINKSNDDKIIFIFIGRIMKDKGIEEFLYVAEKVTLKYKNVLFYILGQFEEIKYKSTLENLCIENKQIKYLGFANDVREYLSNVDCIINPTTYHEGMSNVLLEAAAMGKPIIASNIPGCREIVDHQINGFLVKPKSSEDLLEKVISFIELDHIKRYEMGKASRIKVEEFFDRNIVIKEYISCINSILS